MTNNTDCEDILELLPIYAGGGASDSQRTEVARHVARCRECLEGLILETRLAGMIAEVQEEQPIPDPGNAKALMNQRLDALEHGSNPIRAAVGVVSSVVGLARLTASLGSVSKWNTLEKRLSAVAGNNWEM